MPQQQRPNEVLLAELQKILTAQQQQRPSERVLDQIKQPVGPVRTPQTSIPTNVQGVEVPVRPEPSVFDAPGSEVGRWVGEVLGVYDPNPLVPMAPVGMAASRSAYTPLRDSFGVYSKKPYHFRDNYTGPVVDKPTRMWRGNPERWSSIHDVKAVGTGQGEAAFTKGVYTGEIPSIARGYATREASMPMVMLNRDAPAGFDPAMHEIMLAAQQRMIPFNGVSVRGSIEEILPQIADPADVQNFLSALKQVDDADLDRLFSASAGHPRSPGYIYEMDAHLNPERVVDWNTNIMNQSAEIRKAVADLLDFAGLQEVPSNASMKGGPLLQRIERSFPRHADTPSIFSDAGIQASRYPAGDVYGHAPGALSNHVVYDKNRIQVLRRYPLLAALLGIAPAQKDDE